MRTLLKLGLQFAICVITVVFILVPDSVVAQLDVQPQQVVLDGPDSRWQLLIARDENGLRFDSTRTAEYRSKDSGVAAVSPDGVVRGVSDGETVVEILANGQTRSIPVVVRGTAKKRRIHFENDVLPVPDVMAKRKDRTGSNCRSSDLIRTPI